MKVIKMTEISKENVVNPIFTGTDVTRQILLPESKDFNLNIVSFGKGVRNKLHTHDSEQVLIVTAGKGIAATETEERVVSVVMSSSSRRERSTGMAQQRIQHSLTSMSPDVEVKQSSRSERSGSGDSLLPTELFGNLF